MTDDDSSTRDAVTRALDEDVGTLLGLEAGAAAVRANVMSGVAMLHGKFSRKVFQRYKLSPPASKGRAGGDRRKSAASFAALFSWLARHGADLPARSAWGTARAYPSGHQGRRSSKNWEDPALPQAAFGQVRGDEEEL